MIEDKVKRMSIGQASIYRPINSPHYSPLITMADNNSQTQFRCHLQQNSITQLVHVNKKVEVRVCQKTIITYYYYYYIFDTSRSLMCHC